MPGINKRGTIVTSKDRKCPIRDSKNWMNSKSHSCTSMYYGKISLFVCVTNFECWILSNLKRRKWLIWRRMLIRPNTKLALITVEDKCLERKWAKSRKLAFPHFLDCPLSSPWIPHIKVVGIGRKPNQISHFFSLCYKQVCHFWPQLREIALRRLKNVWDL